MIKNAYNNALEDKFGSCGVYNFSPGGGSSCIRFLHEFSLEREASGWKTHLSVDADYVESATDIVIDVCAQHGVAAFDVSNFKKTRVSAPSSGGAGEIFTLYDTGEYSWAQIICDLEEEFQKAGIPAGPPIIGDSQVPGSHGYCFRRNSGPYRDALSTVEAGAINPKNPSNPYNLPDPIKGVNLEDEAVFYNLVRAGIYPITSAHEDDNYIIGVRPDVDHAGLTEIGIDPSKIARVTSPAIHKLIIPYAAAKAAGATSFADKVKWPSGVPDSPAKALEYIVMARDYVAGRAAPANYRQQSRSDDFRPVGEDLTRPAILDASYKCAGKYFLSLSCPDFVKQDIPYEDNGHKDESPPKLRFLPGFSSLHLGYCLEIIAKDMGIKTDEVQIGKDKRGGAFYVEFETDAAGYDYGRKLISAIVHGDSSNDEQLFDRLRKMSGHPSDFDSI